jgi:N-dimethylarginine dimethylaminohydrolase
MNTHCIDVQGVPPLPMTPSAVPVALPAAESAEVHRSGRARHFAMCPPRFFEVAYAINPWMQPARPVDRDRAVEQWNALRAAYVGLGHTVEDLVPVPGLPDMVFTANAGIVVGSRALLSRFRHPERTAEEAAFADWFAAHGFEVVQASGFNEGEGDYLVSGGRILAGSGFRSAASSHREVETHFGIPVVSLRLVDPRFYHLDTALAILDDDTIAYYPAAFSAASRRRLQHLYPDALVTTEADAVAFGLNACSDGRHVVLASGATALAAQLADRGFEPVLVDTSELQKAGGSAKCCTLEIRS